MLTATNQNSLEKLMSSVKMTAVFWLLCTTIIWETKKRNLNNLPSNQRIEIKENIFLLKSVHFNTQLHDPHFFQNCGTFQYNISWLCFDVSWCCIEKYHNFERNEDCATVFLKWTDFKDYIFSMLDCEDCGSALEKSDLKFPSLTFWLLCKV